jgi:hypothetical protein
MRKLNMLSWILFGMALVMALPAGAGTLYHWTGEDGSVSFTDDWKRVPEVYQGEARKIESGNLSQYERYTPRRDGSQAAYVKSLRERVARLRVLNRTLERGHAPIAVAPTHTVLALDDDTSISIPNSGAADEEPIIIEQQRVMDPRASTTTTVKVVRQGDRVLSISRPNVHHSDSSWPEMSDLLDGTYR